MDPTYDARHTSKVRLVKYSIEIKIPYKFDPSSKKPINVTIAALLEAGREDLIAFIHEGNDSMPHFDYKKVRYVYINTLSRHVNRADFYIPPEDGALIMKAIKLAYQSKGREFYCNACSTLFRSEGWIE